ncbi:hypothetical protein [Microvirga lenta]|uniref:hypothetical protein n=1 Tax=Microvirga lenta TaxID=2881337 RepID=UPI001CFFE9BC|nr:hypothetical protein [Microvirga lenta]MCB5176419.1 hypothetical protein [Microvirga lenta]
MARNLATNAHLPATQDERIRRSPPGRDTLVALTNLGLLVAKRPLVIGESEQDYDELLAEIAAAVAPSDTIETLWVKDIADLKWEAMRLRRIQASLLISAAKSALARLLRSGNAGVIDGTQTFTVSELVNGFAEGDGKATAEVERVLAHFGKDMDAILAEALIDKLDQIGPIERMITGADLRRNKVLRDIDRRRDAFARRLRASGYANTER